MAGRIACDEINETGGVFGRPLELIIEDDQSLPPSAVEAAEKLLDLHKCVAIIGNLLSNSRIAVAYQVAEPRKIPYLNFSFYEGSILSRYFFHFAALPNQQIDRMIPYMKERYGAKMYFAGNNYEWPRGSIDAAKSALERSNGFVVGEEYFSIGAKISELEQLLERLENSGADVFVPYFAGTDQVNLLTLFTRKKLKQKIAVVMGHYDEIMASVLPADVRADFFSSNTYFMTVNTQENKKYLSKLASMPGITGIWPNGNGILTNFGEGTYLCVKAFALAAIKAGSLHPEDLVAALETISITGPQGLIQIDKETHHARVNSYLSQCQPDGSFKIIQNFGSAEPVMPERYRHLKIRSQAALEEEIRLQARILEHMTEGVSLVQLNNGSIIYSNQGFEKMFGFRSNELAGKHISLIYAPTDISSQEIAEEINTQLYRKGIWRGELKTTKKDGTLFWCAVTISAFTHGKYGEVLMGVYKDITERKENEEILSRAKQEAERANQAKSVFLASMSHEIRTPMNAIIGMAELLSETELTEEQRKYVQVFKGAGESLLSLINDILDISRIERNEFELDRELLNLIDLVESCVDILSIKSRQKGIELQYVFNQEMLPMVYGDPLRLRQVLLNLIGNAVKFTIEGGVFISIHAEKQRENILPISFVIRDTGIGIDADQQANIFNAFMQENASITKEYGGTGLGLSISKLIVEKMGGRITLESKKGEGSIFTVAIPFEAEQFSHTKLKEEEYRALKNKKALLFDPKELSRDYIAGALESSGLAVHSTGEQDIFSLLEKAEKNGQAYDLLILVCDDGKDKLGCGIAKQIYENQPDSKLKIITVSDHLLCDKMGGPDSKLAGCCQVKPVQRRKLLSTINAMLESSATELTALENILQNPQRSFEILLVDDSHDNRMLAQAFLKKLPFTIDTAVNGLEAFEKFKSNRFDLVLMDIQMPVMDGFTAMRNIRDWEASKNRKKIPIIALTAYAMKEDKDRCLEAGADGYLSKPLKKKALINIIQQYLSQKV